MLLKVAIDSANSTKLYVTTGGNGVYAIELQRLNPAANAGADFTYSATALNVPLSAINSVDNGGCIVGYSWTQLSGPAATTAPSNLVNTAFVPSANGTHVFRLTVTDNDGDSSTDDISIDVQSSIFTVPTPTTSSSGGGGLLTPVYLLFCILLLNCFWFRHRLIVTTKNKV